MMKVGITGGIGSGKSTVCRLFARLGVAVYDSDAGAKRLMTEDAELRRRITDRFGAGGYVILESALLFDAGFDACVDRTVAVLAPEELRVERTCRRDGRTPGEVRLRIAAQTDDDTLSAKADYTLVNILESDLEPAVAELHRIFSHEAHDR